MQTFLAYKSFEESAKCLDNKRLGKQRVECLQILNALKKGEYICDQCKESWHEYIPLKCKCHFSNPIKTPWYNHPAVQMWKGYELALIEYGMEICRQWINRGFKDNCLEKLDNLDLNKEAKTIYPNWLGNEKFHASHRSNLLRKNPEWYSKFGWTEANDLPYWWPTKEIDKKA